MNDEVSEFPVRKKRGRPAIGLEPMTPAMRKREQRIRQAEAIQEKPSNQWTAAECLAVLSGSQWRGSVLDKAAWEQLGKLRGYM